MEQESICSVLGPPYGLKDFHDCYYWISLWNLDPLIIRKPSGEVHNFVRDNGVMKPRPPYSRAMEMVKLLEDQDIQSSIGSHNKHLEIYRNAASQERFFAAGAGESVEPVITTMVP